MTPEDMDIMQRELAATASGERVWRKSFLERRNAQIVAPWRASIDYPGALNLLIVHNPSAIYDYYVLQSFYKTPLGTFKHVLLNIRVNKIPFRSDPRYFDLFGEEIPNEKNRRNQ
jgi:hypothetical protein